MVRRRLFVVVGLLVVPLALASCGYPIAGGLLGALLLVGALLAGGLTLASVPGCITSCLSPPRQLDGHRRIDLGTDQDLTPCLSVDARVGPCLKAAPDQASDQTPSDAGVPSASLELPADAERLAAINRLEADGVLTSELAARLRRLG